MYEPDNIFFDFCKRWYDKSKSYSIDFDTLDDTEKLKRVFDQFFSFWVLYNCLYNEFCDTSTSDRTKAIDGVFDLIHANINNEQKQTIIVLCTKIKSIKTVCRLNFYSNRSLSSNVIRRRQRNSSTRRTLPAERVSCKFFNDEQLIQGLDNSDINEKLQAALVALYQIRCNLFHGDKSFTNNQINVLKPLIELLEK